MAQEQIAKAVAHDDQIGVVLASAGEQVLFGRSQLIFDLGLQTALAIGCTSIVVLTAITVSRLAGWYSPVDSMGITQSVVEGREPYIVSCLFGQAIAIQVSSPATGNTPCGHMLRSRLPSRLHTRPFTP